MIAYKISSKRTAIKFLKKFTATDIIEEVERHVPTFENDEGFFVSGEHEHSYMFVDYYGEFRGGYPWINSKIESGLATLGFFLEWKNPGCLTLCKT